MILSIVGRLYIIRILQSVLPDLKSSKQTNLQIKKYQNVPDFFCLNRTKNDRNVPDFFTFLIFWMKKDQNVPTFKLISKKELIVVYCNYTYFVPISNFLALEKCSYLYFSLANKFETQYKLIITP